MNTDSFSIAYQDLLSRTLLNATALTIAGLDPSSAVYIDQNQNLADYVLTNGQLLIGSNGNNPQANTLTAGSSMNITNGPGTITIDTVQPISPTDNPTFNSVTVSNLTALQIVGTDATKKLQSLVPTSASGMLTTVIGNNVQFDTPQDLRTSAIPSFPGLNGNGKLQYSTGTCSQSGFTITGSGTTFTAGMAGGLFLPARGSASVIQTFNSVTSLTSYTSQTLGAGTRYTIFYSLGSIGWAISPNGNFYLRTISDSGANTTGVTLQLVPNAGGASYNIDINTYNTPFTTPCNGRMQFTDSTFGCDYGYWSKIQGANANALQRLFRIQANKTVTTFNNTLDTTTTGDANFIGTVTVGNLIDSGLTVSALVGSNGSKQLQSLTITNANGSNLSLSGTVLTSSLTQDLQSTASPTFNTLTLSGLTPNLIVQTNGTSQLFAGTIPLGTAVSGVLPIINGGCNSSTPLTNGKLMVSSGGAIVEGTSSTQPSFQDVTIQKAATSAQLLVLANSGAGALIAHDTAGFTMTDLTGFQFLRLIGYNVFTMNNQLDDGSGLLTAVSLAASSLTPNTPVFTDGSKKLVSVTTVPIASGGTNSGTPLANTCLMVSSGGAIVEGTSSDTPTFSRLTVDSTNPAVVIRNNAANTNRATLQLDGMNSGATAVAMQQDNGGMMVISNPGGHIAFYPKSGSAVVINQANNQFIVGPNGGPYTTMNFNAPAAGRTINVNDFGGTSEMALTTSGTWTPSLQFGGAAVGMTYGLRTARWTKIGPMVYISCQFQLTAKGSSTGNATIVGLPFTPVVGQPESFVNIQSWNFMGGSVTGPLYYSIIGVSFNFIQQGATILTNTDFTATSELGFTGFYFAT